MTLHWYTSMLFWIGFVTGDLVGLLTLCFVHLLFGVNELE